MSGPSMNPMNPKVASPPNTPMMTSAGCIRVVLLTIIGRSTLSTWLSALPSTMSTIVRTISPSTNSHAAMGIHTINAPMTGMMLTSVVASAQNIALGTPSEK